MSAETVVGDLQKLSDYLGDLTPKMTAVRFLLLEARERLKEKDQIIDNLRAEIRGLKKQAP